MATWQVEELRETKPPRPVGEVVANHEHVAYRVAGRDPRFAGMKIQLRRVRSSEN